MPARLLPLFPLQVVVFPRTQLPLHIFEERYKRMVGEAIREQSEFGIVLAKEDGIVNAGCTVTVDKVLKTYADGRMDIITRGRRRFEVLSLDQDEEYLRGEVDFFDDDEPGPGPAELQRETLLQYKALMEIGEGRSFGEPDFADPQLSFQLAQAVADLDFQSVLLRNRSELERLKALRDFLTGYIPRRRQVNRMKRLAPLNGCGGRPSGA